MSSPKDLSSAATSSIHAGFGGWREVLLYPVLADGFTQRAIGQSGALLPARLRLLLSGQRFAEEREILIEERLGQVVRGTMDDVPPEIGLPRIDGLACHQRIHFFEKVWGGNVKGVEMAHFYVREIDAEIEIWRQLLKVGNRIDVIVIFRLTQFGAAGRSLGQSRFDLHHLVRFLGRGLRAVTRQSEHFGYVCKILLADLLKPRIIYDVIVAIGKRKSALGDLRNLLGGVLLILPHTEAEQGCGRPRGFQIAHNRRNLVRVGQARQCCAAPAQAAPAPSARRGRYSCRRHRSRHTASAEESSDLWQRRPSSCHRR